ncbi:MAG: ABC transporter permease, partial [Bacillota bacterium]
WMDGHKAMVKSFLGHREIGVVVAMVVVFAVFFSMKREFLSVRTLGDILTVAAELGVTAVGVSFLMISGEMDLSVGSNFALSAMVLAALITRSSCSPYLAFIAALLCAAGIGAINGVVTLSARIPSFIATLGAMMFWRGVALYLTQGWPISLFADVPLVRWLGGGMIFATVRISALWWVLLGGLFWVALQKTAYGNWVFATGGKQGAARALGVPTTRVKLTNFMLAGLLAGVAGCLQFGRMGSMSPVWGQELPLEAIAAAVVGGNSLTGGVGSILGAMLGALTMASIRIGLVMVGAPAYWYMSFVGFIVVAAVAINVKLGEAISWNR